MDSKNILQTLDQIRQRKNQNLINILKEFLNKNVIILIFLELTSNQEVLDIVNKMKNKMSLEYLEYL